MGEEWLRDGLTQVKLESREIMQFTQRMFEELGAETFVKSQFKLEV